MVRREGVGVASAGRAKSPADHSRPFSRFTAVAGFERPSRVQQLAIGPILRGRDTIIQSNHGTGRTAALLIGLLERLDLNLDRRESQALVLTATPDLSTRVERLLAAMTDRIPVATYVCDAGPETDRARVAGAHVVVGTPGRVRDLVRRHELNLSALRVALVDDVDSVVSSGSSVDLLELFSNGIPRAAQVALTTAAAPPEVAAFATRVLREPAVVVELEEEHWSLDGTRQFYVSLDDDRWKLDTLVDIWESMAGRYPSGMAVFCNTDDRAARLAEELRARDISAEHVHLGVDVPERLRAFNAGEIRALVISDDLIRRHVIPGQHLVINFEMPTAPVLFVRRYGRPSRFRPRIRGITLTMPEDASRMRALEAFGGDFRELPADLDI